MVVCVGCLRARLRVLSLTELSANITRFNQALTDDATIRHISLVGCNLDNPTDNSTSTYAAQILQNLKKIGVTSTSAGVFWLGHLWHF
jgi:UDP-N-acetylmuramyl tripeptide synthase